MQKVIVEYEEKKGISDAGNETGRKSMEAKQADRMKRYLNSFETQKRKGGEQV